MPNRTLRLYVGKIDAHAPTRLVYHDLRPPYPKALVGAVLLACPDQRWEEGVLAGEIPAPLNPRSGCRFHTRCPLAMPRCSEVEPPLREVSPSHHVACHLYDAGKTTLPEA